MHLSIEQYKYLLNPLKSTRIATRKQGGKDLSYVEAWDIKAHLTRIFGFGNWDSEVTSSQHIETHKYLGGSDRTAKMFEVIWSASVRLTVRTYDESGDEHVTVYCESAVGSATGSAERAGVGDLHDNAVKQAASDALKRCAINLGTQFGLSLYNDGSRQDVVRQTLVTPPGFTTEDTTDQQAEQTLSDSLGAQRIDEDALPPVASGEESQDPEGEQA